MNCFLFGDIALHRYMTKNNCEWIRSHKSRDNCLYYC